MIMVVVARNQDAFADVLKAFGMEGCKHGRALCPLVTKHSQELYSVLIVGNKSFIIHIHQIYVLPGSAELGPHALLLQDHETSFF